jgi:hypothetical protein
MSTDVHVTEFSYGLNVGDQKINLYLVKIGDFTVHAFDGYFSNERARENAYKYAKDLENAIATYFDNYKKRIAP